MYMFNIIIGIVIGITLTKVLKTKEEVKTINYDELIKRCIEEANADLSKTGKKKHSNSR